MTTELEARFTPFAHLEREITCRGVRRNNSRRSSVQHEQIKHAQAGK
jgi:hypothetical protein